MTNESMAVVSLFALLGVFLVVQADAPTRAAESRPCK